MTRMILWLVIMMESVVMAGQVCGETHTDQGVPACSSHVLSVDRFLTTFYCRMLGTQMNCADYEQIVAERKRGDSDNTI